MYPSKGTSASVYSANTRLQTRDFFPGSVQGAALRPVKVAPTSVTVSATVNNGASAVFQFGKTTNNHNVVITQPNISVFIGGTDPAANLMPGGTGFNNSQFILFGPLHSSYLFNGTAVNQASIETRIYVSNASAAPVVVTVVATYNYIANGGDIFP